VRRFLPRIDFEFSAVFPAQRSPSPVALDLVETLRRALAEMEGCFEINGIWASVPFAFAAPSYAEHGIRSCLNRRLRL
jgi:hypothetical protein